MSFSNDGHAHSASRVLIGLKKASQARTVLVIGCLIALAAAPPAGSAQQAFTLKTDDGRNESSAELDANSLVITSSLGGRTTYRRNEQFDSSDGQWIGYYSSTELQIIRWPRSSSGHLQIGTLTGSQPVYHESRMAIYPNAPKEPLQIGEPPSGLSSSSSLFGSSLAWLPQVMPTDLSQFSGLGELRLDPSVHDLFTADDRLRAGAARQSKAAIDPRPLFLANFSSNQQTHLLQGGSLTLVTSIVNRQFYSEPCWLTPAGTGVFRFQSFTAGGRHALAARNQQSVQLVAVSHDVRQLWRPVVHPSYGYLYAFENVYYPGYCLSMIGPGIGLQPLAYYPNQVWFPLAPPVHIQVQPSQRNTRIQIQPNPPLPPAQIVMSNQNSRPIEVLLNDVRANQNIQKITIAPNASETVIVDRDSGSTVHEVSEVLLPDGQWRSQELQTMIPPQSYYDVSVYEVRLQSIAIDRTGKSPNVIEDVNYAGKSVGWFGLPPGERLRDGQILDVFELAKAAGNPGAVRRLPPAEEAPKTDDPLEQLLNQSQPARRKF